MELLRSWTEKLRPAADPESPLKYEPLTSPKEIRLIEIQSGYAMIKCSLYHAIYDEAEYHAVSYTWGDPRPWQSFEESKAWEQADEYWVSCNGQKLQVARNLHDLLTSLRAKRYFKTPIWVDSICINQADLDERSHQVAQMGEIYSHAYGSIVWLGMEDDEITVPTCAFIKSFGKALGDHPEEKVCSFSWDHPRLYEMIEHPPVTTEQWSLLAQFCSRRWFGRGWVLQEYALPPRTSILYGYEQLFPEPLMIILAAIWGSGWVPSLLECTSMSEEVYENAWSTIVVSQWEGPASMTGAGFDAGFQYAITPGQRLYCYLHKLLWFSVGRQYSDRRDHAFSPLALVATYITPEAEITDWIVPDYRKPADTVLIDLCLLILRNIPSLSLLCWSQGFQDPEHDLPTWVPSFGKALSTTPLEKHNSKHKATEYFPLSLEQCPGRDQSTIRSLPITYILFDTIASLCAVSNAQTVAPKLCQSWFETALAMGANCGITGQTSFEALWRTFIGNYVPIVDSPQHSSPVLFLHFVHSIYIKTLYSSHGGLDLEDTYKSQRSYHSLLEKSGMDFLPELKRFEEAKVQYFDIYHDDNLSSTDRREFFKQKLKELIRPPATWFDTSFRSVSHGRRLMLTEKNILGLAPSKAEVGDKIYFIQGAQVPYVLRKYAASGKLQLVGDVYLHGLMQGELEKFEPLERVNGFLD